MNIAELFVNLGIKGAEKTVGALSNVTKGLGNAKDMSLEAKAGILAAMYALERLFAASGAAGTNLTNFNALTGMSTQQLQQWQYAARQAGVAGEEMTGSFKAVQNTMTNMLLGKGAPEGLAMLANKVGFDPKRARDTVYVLEQLQKYAQAVPKDVGNVGLKSFGLSEGVIAAMRRNAFTPDMLNKAPTYNNNEIKQLDRANIAWSNLGNKIEMAVGHFNAAHGLQLVKDITQVTDAVLKLVDALIKFGEKYKVFGIISKGLNFAADAVESKPGTVLGETHMEKKLFNWVKNAVTPSVPATAGAGAPAQNVEINQNLHFQHDGQNHQKNSESHKKAIKDAYRQLQSQVQGS